jgi:flagellar hook-associated protein 2
VTGIQLSGLASGMDADAIISQLMSIESQPRTRVARQQVAIQARQDALRSVDTKLSALKLAADDLRSAALWSDARTYDWTAAAGDLTVAYKANGVDASKAFDLTGQTLDESVATINGASDSPVWAVNVGGKLSLSRRETGDHATWGFTASGSRSSQSARRP